MKYKLFILILILFGCTTLPRIIDTNEFNILIKNANITNITQKKVINEIINNTNIFYNKNSNWTIELEIEKIIKYSLVSSSIIYENANIKYITNYKIINNSTKEIVIEDKIIVIDDSPIISKRFVNYRAEEYLSDNFIKNLAIRLESKISPLLKHQQN